MTQIEFNQWLKFHCQFFPQVTEWLSGKPLAMITEEWARAMANTSLEDAMNCTRKMISGEMDHPNRFETHSLIAVVCKSCQPKKSTLKLRPVTKEELEEQKKRHEERLRQDAIADELKRKAAEKKRDQVTAVQPD